MLLCNECGRLHCPGAALRKSLGLAHSLPCGSCQAPSILVVSFHREAARSPQEDGDVGDQPVPSALNQQKQTDPTAGKQFVQSLRHSSSPTEGDVPRSGGTID